MKIKLERNKKFLSINNDSIKTQKPKLKKTQPRKLFSERNIIESD